MKPLHIAVGVIQDDAGRVLVSQRKADCAYAGQWEFPGGKCEPGESVEVALARELLEELGIEVRSARPLIRLTHRYPDRFVLLDTWVVTSWQGKPEGREGQRCEWVRPADLDHYPMLAANKPILRATQLPAHYLITPAPGSNTDPNEFADAVAQSLKTGVRLLRLRAPAHDDASYLGLAKACLARCHPYGARLLLDRRPDWVEALGAAGLHLSAAKLGMLRQRPLADKYLLAASCHNRIELEQAVACGADFAVLGPVRSTPTHPRAQPLGWSRFVEVLGESPIPAYAIGGMGKVDVADAWRHRAQGIAAIRALWPAGSV